MALITRLTRLFKADFHAVLDSIEEADTQLKQAIREMEFELQQDMQAMALLQHEKSQLNAIIADAEKQMATLNDELDICFEAEKEDLARDLIRRKLQNELATNHAEKQSARVQTNIDKLRQRIKERQQQLDNMQQKLELLVSEDSSSIRGNLNPGADSSIRSEDIEIAFLREKQARVKQ